jgi:hypothetical protein
LAEVGKMITAYCLIYFSAEDKDNFTDEDWEKINEGLMAFAKHFYELR